MTIFERVCNWNAKRYDRVLHVPLLLKLLVEEFDEWLIAETPVDKVDALCDIIFVAMGGIWKTGDTRYYDERTCIAHLGTALDLDLLPMAVARAAMTNLTIHEDAPVIQMLTLIITAASMELQVAHGFSKLQAERALSIVCDSNDSKSVVKTEPSIKANVDKGPYFVAPEPRLQALIDEVRHALN